MAMTTGGTDPQSDKNINKDTKNDPKVGTVAEKVRARQFNIIKKDTNLYGQIEEFYKEFKKQKDSIIIGFFQELIKDRLNKIR